jgi:hypothetical protein
VIESYDDFKVGDQVHCLAWLGKLFTVASKDDNTGRIALQGSSATDPYGAQVDLFPDTMWMVTHQPWDQIWPWPDRAGEHATEVFERYAQRHHESEVVAGYYNEEGLQLSGEQTFLTPNAKKAMAFRLLSVDVPLGQIRVEPVARIDAQGGLTTVIEPGIAASQWVAVGPNAALRVGMRSYRWALSFGELILNWQDFAPPAAS